MRIAVVHDFLAQVGGAERVVEAVHEIWPDAPIYTSIYDAKATLASFAQMDVRTSFLQRFPLARNAQFHKYLLPLYPIAFEKLDLRGYDVVLSSASSFAKGVITDPETCHICYCHTPSRFAWRYQEYIEQGRVGPVPAFILPFMIHQLRLWDYQAAQRVDYFVANSFNIARRILKYYGRKSDILYPPVHTCRFNVTPTPAADYFLVVSRFLPYKRVDLAVAACTQLNVPLKVVGGGPDEANLRRIAGPSVEFLGRIPDGQVEQLFANCQALLFPGEEDCGITPLEAMACGRPVVALRAGGAMETVIEGKTGVFFDQPTVESLMDAIRRVETMAFDPRRIRLHAEAFDTKAFQSRLAMLVRTHLEDHRIRYGRLNPKDGPDPFKIVLPK